MKEIKLGWVSEGIGVTTGALPWSHRRSVFVALLCALAVHTASASMVISELFYDAAGSDDGKVFVELYGDPGMSLDGWVVEATNGSNGAIVFSLTLMGTLPDDGFLVVADANAEGVSEVPNADVTFDNVDHQNGPENLLLKWDGTIIDALGFGDFGVDDIFQGEGYPAPDAPAGASVARFFANRDCDDNAIDFGILDPPTPGTGPLSEVPEPDTALLSFFGLVTLGALVRVRSYLCRSEGGWPR